MVAMADSLAMVVMADSLAMVALGDSLAKVAMADSLAMVAMADSLAMVAMAVSLATKGQTTSSPGTLNLHEMEPKPLHNTPLTMPAAPKARLPVYPDRGDRFYHQIRQLGII